MAISSDTHIVIVEDDGTSADVLIRLLRQLHITFTVIFDTRSVENEIKNLSRVDMIFLDLEMSERTGYDILASLKTNPETRDITIVAYTAHTSEIGNAQTAGFNGFLGKPISAAEFPKQLKSMLRGEGVWMR